MDPQTVMKMREKGLLNVVGKIQAFVYRLSGGALLGKTDGVPTLLLTTTGRKSGRPRTTPLLYLREGESYVVVASSAAKPQHPAWWLNLEQNPEATIQVGAQKIRVRAERADPAEKQRLWPTLTKMYEGFAVYQENVERDIPVVFLRPAG
jgi:deazaflavin-dependent oxidoreductase (nitroreductase family)